MYRQATPRWRGTRAALRRAVREALRPLRRNLAALMRLARDARFAALWAGAVLAGTPGSARAEVDSPISLSDVAAGMGGFAITGEEPGDRLGLNVSGIGDVNGDGLWTFPNFRRSGEAEEVGLS